MEHSGMAGSSYQPLSVKDWVITILITAIPLVGLVMLFVWAFGSGTHPGKANWAKATLIWLAIFVVLYIILGVVIFSSSPGVMG